jgi:hypothetical protein
VPADTAAVTPIEFRQIPGVLDGAQHGVAVAEDVTDEAAEAAGTDDERQDQRPTVEPARPPGADGGAVDVAAAFAPALARYPVALEQMFGEVEIRLPVDPPRDPGEARTAGVVNGTLADLRQDERRGSPTLSAQLRDPILPVPRRSPSKSR